MDESKTQKNATGTPPAEEASPTLVVQSIGKDCEVYSAELAKLTKLTFGQLPVPEALSLLGQLIDERIRKLSEPCQGCCSYRCHCRDPRGPYDDLGCRSY